MKSFILQNFNASATVYEKYACAQKKIAKKLASFYREDFLHRSKMLEVGCGTGFMTKEVLNITPKSHILATDIAPNMLSVFKKNYPSIACQLMDGEHVNLDIKVDCIYSNLVVQWFTNLSHALYLYKKILNEKGVVIFSTLLRSNFPQWQEACNYANMPHHQDRFLSEVEILKVLEENFEVKSIVEKLDIKFLKPTDFLLYIKRIGVKCSNNITSVSNLRKACNYLDKYSNNTVSYSVAYIKAYKK